MTQSFLTQTLIEKFSIQNEKATNAEWLAEPPENKAEKPTDLTSDDTTNCAAEVSAFTILTN